tara:strand:- start:69 stop:266 length:198 start_codon:yes stop_codon:yes gene_type:complete
MKHTDLFIVINERTLNTMKGFGGKTAKFKSMEQANEKACKKLELWSVVPIQFRHEFIQHKAPLTH